MIWICLEFGIWNWNCSKLDAKRSRRGFLRWRGEDDIFSFMSNQTESEAFDRAVRPVLRVMFPDKAQAVLKLPPDLELRARIEFLASKSTEGQLTPDERAEYESYVLANKFLAILRRQAREMAASEP